MVDEVLLMLAAGCGEFGTGCRQTWRGCSFDEREMKGSLFHLFYTQRWQIEQKKGVKLFINTAGLYVLQKGMYLLCVCLRII